MKISPLVNTINTRNTNFTGLWGKTTRKTDIDPAIGIPTVYETYYYFPFLDETKEDIENVQFAYNNAYIEDKDGTSKYKIIECKQCTTLPFKQVSFEENYQKYEPSKRLTSSIKKIHKAAEKLFLNNKFGTEQVSAANKYVSARLDTEA